jgi:hypothetical protein
MQDLAEMVAQSIACMLDFPSFSITHFVPRLERVSCFTHHHEHLRIGTQKLLSFFAGEELTNSCRSI